MYLSYSDEPVVTFIYVSITSYLSNNHENSDRLPNENKIFIPNIISNTSLAVPLRVPIWHS